VYVARRVAFMLASFFADQSYRLKHTYSIYKTKADRNVLINIKNDLNVAVTLIFADRDRTDGCAASSITARSDVVRA
jgi:hypothetical protein